jgi:hypothetical protein
VPGQPASDTLPFRPHFDSLPEEYKISHCVFGGFSLSRYAIAASLVAPFGQPGQPCRVRRVKAPVPRNLKTRRMKEIRMINAMSHTRGGEKMRAIGISMALFFLAAALSACSGGAATTTVEPPVSLACVSGDPATADNCGTLIIGLTDGDGDFLSYSVTVMSLVLEKANGSTIEVLPSATRVDFASYVDLTEFIGVATVPPGAYVAGTIRLDYSDAEVFVEDGDVAREAIVVDATGSPLTQTSLKIRLADRNQLFITRARTSLLTIDFDLDASHSVDLSESPAIATSEPFIVAELDPIDAKDIRVRGRFIAANVAEMYYTVALRPFYDRVGDFGRIRVHVTDDTDFEVNGEMWSGAEGLRALTAAGAGTLTVAQGTLNVAQRQFTANIVLAGSSVPGHEKDAVKGNVISRNGNVLVVRGGTVILSDAARSFFRDDVTVTVGPATKVYKTHYSDRPMAAPDRLLNISAISVGQAVTIRGVVTANDAPGVHIDATEGAVLMHPTHLGGIVNTVMPGQTDIELRSIDRRRAAAFKFAGTGGSPATDADPANYEVATGNMLLAAQAEGKPVMVRGFPFEFGAAPPDFEGRTIVDYADARSALGVGWGAAGTTTPFLMMSSDGLLLDNFNGDIDQRHYIKQGPVLIDLTTLDEETLIAPRETGRKLFVVKTSDSLQLYGDFDDFLTALSLQLDGTNAARSMYARGQYNADTNIFTAYKIFVYILEP